MGIDNIDIHQINRIGTIVMYAIILLYDWWIGG